MKTLNILALFILLTISTAFAGNIKPSLVDGVRYPLKFKIIDARLLCPETASGISCKALGSIITVKAELSSCIDEVLNFDYSSFQYGEELNIEIDSYALRHPMANDVKCTKVQTYIKKIHVTNEFYQSITLKNITL